MLNIIFESRGHRNTLFSIYLTMRFSTPPPHMGLLFYDKHKYTRLRTLYPYGTIHAHAHISCICAYKYSLCLDVITFKCNLHGRCSWVGPFGRVLDINMKIHIHFLRSMLLCTPAARTKSNDTARSVVQLRHCYGVVKGN